LRRGNAYAAVAAEDGPLADLGRVARVERVCLYIRFAVPAIAGSRRGGLLVRGLADIRSAAVAKRGRQPGQNASLGAAQRPLRTGHCRVRELRCSFTIATFLRETHPASDLAGFSPCACKARSGGVCGVIQRFD